MRLFVLQRVDQVDTVQIDAFSNKSFVTTYVTNGPVITFEDNPEKPDLYNIPRRIESIYTMVAGGVNVDLGLDRSKQVAKMTLTPATQNFYNTINEWYLNDVPDQMYVLKDHKDENWILKWKNLNPKMLGTLPMEFLDDIPMPPSAALNRKANYAQYADVYEIELEFSVVDQNAVVQAP